MVTSSSPVQNYQSDPDVQLMLRVQGGDDAAFTLLVEKYQNRLLAIFTNLVGDSNQAEDLAQEVFLRVYRARKGYEPTAKFSTWLFQIVTNLSHNTKRSRGRRKEVQFSPQSDSQALSPGEALVPEKSSLMPTRLADLGEVQAKIQAAMEKLGERQKMALILHKFEGLPYSDIATVMEMTPQAVKSLLSRARESLREALASYVS